MAQAPTLNTATSTTPGPQGTPTVGPAPVPGPVRAPRRDQLTLSTRPASPPAPSAGPTPTPAPTGTPAAAPTPDPRIQNEQQVLQDPKAGLRQKADAHADIAAIRLEDDGQSVKRQVTGYANWGFKAAMVPSVAQGTVQAFRMMHPDDLSSTPVRDALDGFVRSGAAKQLGGLDKVANRAAGWVVQKPKAVGLLDKAGGKVMGPLGRFGEWFGKLAPVKAVAGFAAEHPMIARGGRILGRTLGVVGTLAGVAIAGADTYLAWNIWHSPKATLKEKLLSGGVAGLMSISALAGGAALLGLTPFGWGALTLMAIGAGTGLVAGLLEGPRKKLTQQRGGAPG